MFDMMVGDRDDFLRAVNCIDDMAARWRDAIDDFDDELKVEVEMELHTQLAFLYNGFSQAIMSHGRSHGLLENKNPTPVGPRVSLSFRQG